MAIGKLLPVLLRRYAYLAYRPDRTFAAGELGQLLRIRRQAPIRLQIIRGLVTPPLPFAEAERKVGPNALSIIRFLANCLRLKLDFSLRPKCARLGRLSFGRLEPEPAGAAPAERLFKLGK